jgi:aryl-alcohol dehydrogenase-like predicted oxidoreductase
VDAVTELAQARGCTPAQLALAWLLAQGPDIVPIPGTRRVTRLDENAGAARITLGDAEVQRIEAVLDAHAVAGTRYPAAGMTNLNV